MKVLLEVSQNLQSNGRTRDLECVVAKRAQIMICHKLKENYSFFRRNCSLTHSMVKYQEHVDFGKYQEATDSYQKEQL